MSKSVVASSAIGNAVVPGDRVLSMPENGEVRAGPGLIPQDGRLVAMKAGLLHQTNTGKLWIEGRQKRYIPSEDDMVIGYITDRQGDNWWVDIGAPFVALLPVLAFEGATRRNRPNLQPGDVVLARVTSAHRDVDPQLSCTDSAGSAAGFGPLSGGLVVGVSSRLARHLLQQPPHPTLAALGRSLQYELAVGLNGRVWVSAASSSATILVANTIKQSEFLDKTQAEALVKHLLQGEPS